MCPLYSHHHQRKAVFLDRDGVINVDHGFVSRWEDFHFLPGAIEGMKLVSDAGYALIIVTNQSGIARGLYREHDYQVLTKTYTSFLKSLGISIEGIYHCPHHPDFNNLEEGRPCNCRKPLPGMFLRAFRDLSVSANSSVMIGDRISDLQAAKAAGISSLYLVASQPDSPPALKALFGQSVYCTKDLKASAIHLLR